MSTAAAPQSVIDLRSDTVTRPTPAMRRAMAEAEVGDDVYAEDPTVNRLQARAAEIFGREAALYFPSGSMANLTAIKTWTHHGTEVICEAQAHIYLYEMAAMTAIAGCMPNTVPAPNGTLTWDLIEPLIRPHIYYRAQTALIELENTHNMHGGTVYPPEISDDICDRAHKVGLARSSRRCADFQRERRAWPQRRRDYWQVRFGDVLSVEGARRAGWLDAGRLARVSSTKRVSRASCSAGECARRECLRRRVWSRWKKRRRFCIATTKMRAIWPKDSRRFAASRSIRRKVVTNILIFDVAPSGKTAAEVVAELGKHGVLCGATGKTTIRMVTHFDVDRAAIDRALAAIADGPCRPRRVKPTPSRQMRLRCVFRKTPAGCWRYEVLV